MRHPKHKVIWNTSLANEFGQLAQGVGGRVIPTNTIFFIRLDQVPIDRRKDVTYRSFSCDMKPNKKETHRMRLMADGDKINYPEDDIGKDLLQQRNIDKRGKMCDVRCQRLLLKHTNGKIRIHAIETHCHPGGNHHQIQLTGDCDGRRIRVL